MPEEAELFEEDVLDDETQDVDEPGWDDDALVDEFPSRFEPNPYIEDDLYETGVY